MQSLPTTKQGNLLMKVFRDFNNCKIALDGYNNLMINGLREYFSRRNSTYNTNPLNLGNQYTIHIVSADFSRQKKILSSQHNIADYQEFSPITARNEQTNYEVPFNVRFFLYNRLNGKRYKVFAPPTRGGPASFKELQLMEFSNFEEQYPDPTYSEYVLYLGNMPVLVGSLLDHYRNDPSIAPYDVGGYFIIRGSEKYFNNTERLRYNEGLVYLSKKNRNDKNLLLMAKYTAQYNTTTVISILPTNEPGEVHMAFSTSVTGTSFDYRIPLLVLKSLQDGSNTWDNSDENIQQLILDVVASGHDFSEMKAIFNTLYGQSTMDVNLGSFFEDFRGSSFVGNYLDSARRFAQQDMFINVNALTRDEVFSVKYRTACALVYRYMQVSMGFLPRDDRDSWAHKRLNTAGILLENKLYGVLDKILDAASIKARAKFSFNKNSQINTSTTTIPESVFNDLINVGSLSSSISDILSKPNAFVNNPSVVEPMMTENYMLRQSLITRITIAANTQGSDTLKRLIHPSQFNIICPANTPEGQQNCGLIKSISIGAFASIQKSYAMQSRLAHAIMQSRDYVQERYNKQELMDSLKNDRDSPGKGQDMYAVSVNGARLGYMRKEDILRINQRIKFTRNNFDVGIAVVEKDREVMLNTSGGRLGSFYLTKNPETNNLFIDEVSGGWEMNPIDLIQKGLLIYLDAQEAIQEGIVIAYSTDKFYSNPSLYSHSMIDPQSLNSAPASTVPFSNHQPGARTTYQCNMVKQAVSGDALGSMNRFDTTLRVLRNPRLPLVQTDIESSVGLDQYPNGMSTIVAFNVSPDSQEDAILFNQTSLDNGMADLSIFHSYKDTFKPGGKDSGKKLIFPENQASNEAYSKLNRSGPYEGIVRVGEFVSSGDVVWNVQRYAKVAVGPRGNLNNDRTKHIIDNQRKTVDINQSGIVDAVDIQTVDDNVITRVRIRDDRSLEVGDKLCTRYAQKGVIGECVDGKDMLLLENDFGSFRPDVLYNSHGIPSRMTIGKMMEPILGNLAAYRMIRTNGSFCRDISMNFAAKLSRLYGMDEHSRFDAYTPDGKFIGKVTCGIVYYQILRHFVKQKNQSRGTGPVDIITRQPVSGIRRRGGLKVGEMETHAFVASGAQNLLEDRLFTNSDQTAFIVSPRCGSISDNKLFSGEGIRCRDKRCPDTSFNRLKLPYAWKVLVFYLAAIGLKIDLNLQKMALDAAPPISASYSGPPRSPGFLGTSYD